MIYHGHSRYNCVALITFKYRKKNFNPETLIEENTPIEFKTTLGIEIVGGNVSLTKEEVQRRFIAQVNSNLNNLIKRFVESGRNTDKLAAEDIEIIPGSVSVPVEKIVITAMPDSKLT